jgi:hypothetical protein
MDATLQCWQLVRRALGAAHFVRVAMAEFQSPYGERDRQAIARAIEHLERAMEELRPLGLGWASPAQGQEAPR